MEYTIFLANKKSLLLINLSEFAVNLCFILTFTLVACNNLTKVILKIRIHKQN